jgi:hypothetical protein
MHGATIKIIMHVFTLSLTTVRILKLNKKTAGNSTSEALNGTVRTREELLTNTVYKSGGFPLHQSALFVKQTWMVKMSL